MIDRRTSPVGWAHLLTDLADAHEHLGALIREMQADPEYGEARFRIDLGHVYAHLNRSWRRRNIPEDFSEAEWESAARFPEDMEPIA